MRPHILLLAGLVAVATPGTAIAQGPLTPSGPVIDADGPSALVPDADFPMPRRHKFKAVFQINSLGDSSRTAASLGTMARFYNLHARNGIARQRVQAAGVAYAGGIMAFLNDSAYQARYGRPNPNRQLIEQLLANGARFAVCGQTAAGRGVKRSDLLPGVQLALSAMTALNVFYGEGFHLNPWG